MTDDEEIWVADSPGVGDTNGPEMDLANGLIISKGISACKYAQFVMVFSR